MPSRCTKVSTFCKIKESPFSTENVKKIYASCVCPELKPQFYRPSERIVIKATGLMEHINIDFKAPLYQ